MGFLYPDKKTDEMFDFEILEDFLFTQNKIEADLRAILARLEDEKYGDKAKDGNKKLDYYTTKLNRNLLTEAFTKACLKHTIHPYVDETLKDIDSDMETAWIKYEHILHPPYSDILTEPDMKLSKGASLRLREKHKDYNKHVMPYYEFFKKPNGEKTRALFGNLQKKLLPSKPLTKEDYLSLKKKDIAAFTQAAYGAMGEPGVMYIITKYMDVFGVDMLTYENMGNKFGLSTIFDAHDTPSFKLIREGEMDSDDWYMYYTGFGNVLYINHEYLPKAKEYILKTLGKKWSCPDLYVKRFDVIEYAILNTDRKRQTKNKSSSHELLYEFSNGATGDYPGIWGHKTWRLYSDNTIEYERKGHVFDKESSEWVNVSDLKKSSIEEEKANALMTLFDNLIKKLKDPHTDYMYTLDGGMYGIKVYSDGEEIANHSSQNYNLREYKDIIETLDDIDVA